MNYKEYKKTGVITLNQEDINDPGTMQVVNNLLAKEQDRWVEEIETIRNCFNLNDDYAMAVWYLRTRSRWTQDLEHILISMARNNEPCPNMCDWTPKEN